MRQGKTRSSPDDRSADPDGRFGFQEDRFALRDDVRLQCDGTSVALTSPVSTFTLRGVGPGVIAALRRLAAGSVPFTEVTRGLAAGERARFDMVLGRIGHLLVHGVALNGRELLRVEHTARDASYEVADLTGLSGSTGLSGLPADSLLRLSRFAFCRSRADTLVLESPLCKVRMLLVTPGARELVAALGSASAPGELRVDGLSPAEITCLLGHLVGAGFVEVGGPGASGAAFPEDADPVLRQWDFHDLLFHSRIRTGRDDAPVGGVFPHLGELDPQPAVKPLPQGPVVPLHRPSLEEIAARDPVLTAAVEGRRSLREYGESPPTAEQLGEFLYRTGRVRVHFEPGPGEQPGGEIVGRPYPNGGSAYELELYLTVRRCAGLDPGIYYYDPVGHQLILVNTDAGDRQAMLTVAALSAGLTTDPDVLITMTSRFQRMSWKYSGIAYATTLRHTGVLYQTMYLVAAAMRLAPCGLGIGNADLAARVLGLDYLRESSVGDFILGSRPDADPGIWDAAQGWNYVNDAEWAAWAGSRLNRRADGS
ncbi:SagB/ThcOx family dehydrogenase [Streptomyces sp. SID335]|nr:SagB/ThcOx family dehydrogenase [Streptomyces sp. SID335]MYZ15762.1 SagB/ThcOx family dehydrogenase [Streptomyces sp. SID337]NDZ88036.1 SagB/ThcOx family dehydrogenase [Streptomyces sp. SID10115]NEA05174.1 SagB/ThcOx family dehydrogenase [Streptomyces sp. SID10116]NEB49731.1 SagB/ThcOx family dehydrogenase [Streptomyces sp. SID339]